LKWPTSAPKEVDVDVTSEFKDLGRKRIFTPEISGLILLPQAGFVYSPCSFSLAILS
jgi:hypothetical protein